MKNLLRFIPLIAIVGLVASFVVPRVADSAPYETQEQNLKRFKRGLIIGNAGTAIDDSYASASQTLDIASVAAVTCLDTTFPATVPGAAVGDTCTLGTPAAPTANISFSCFVSATDTVKIRACNVTAGAIDPASGAYSVRTFDP